jgi:hypothetical protein
MTKADQSDITILLDRSGSMASVKSDVEGGFARLLEEQRKLPGECALSLVQFDSEGVEPVYTARPIREAQPLELHPRGLTPLLDAVGRTVVATGERLAGMPEPARPGRVLFVIITDGRENASREYTKAQVATLVERQRRDYNWEFLYLGANVDAFAEAGGLGIGTSHAATCVASPAGMAEVFALASYKCASHRAGQSVAFTAEEREALKTE